MNVFILEQQQNTFNSILQLVSLSFFMRFQQWNSILKNNDSVYCPIQDSAEGDIFLGKEAAWLPQFLSETWNDYPAGKHMLRHLAQSLNKIFKSR